MNPEGFIEIHADQIPWQPNPAVSGGEFAILIGRLDEAGPLVLRVKVPPNTQVMPHTHPDARTYTVLAGEWKLGFGDRYDEAELSSFPSGSLYRLPARALHFQASGPEGAVIQIESTGPTGDDFLHPGPLVVMAEHHG